VEERDIFGFQKAVPPSPTTVVDETPIDPLDAEVILGELYRMPLGARRPRWEWSDSVEWGEGETGTLKVHVNPLGSHRAVIHRRVMDLQGTPCWICKKILPFVETEHDKVETELAWAERLYEHLKVVDDQMVEMPSRDYRELEKLAISVAGKAAATAPPILIYEGLKMVDSENYIVFFTLRGHGVEAPGGMRVEQFNINLNYKPERGLIRCWGNEVSSPTRGHLWYPQPSEWDELFSPAQPRKEIESAILNALSTY
jgi:hypothetical protein